MSKRLFLTLSEDEFLRFEFARAELGMQRSQYLKYLLAGKKEIRPVTIKEKQISDKLSEICNYIKVIALKDNISDDEKIYLMQLLRDMNEFFEVTFITKGGEKNF